MLKDMSRLLVALTLIAATAGFLLSLVESATREPIKEQRRLQMLKALNQFSVQEMYFTENLGHI